MTRSEAIAHLVQELGHYSLLFLEHNPDMEADVVSAQALDLEALLAVGITPQEIEDAQ